jgi:hypothetical protein
MKRRNSAVHIGLLLFLGLALGLAGTPHAALTRANLALLDGVTVQASGELGEYAAEKAIDGNSRTRWDAGYAASEENPCWITVDLGGIYALSKVTLKGATPGQRKLYSVSISTDNVNWTSILPMGPATNRKQQSIEGLGQGVNADPLLAQYVRYEVFGGNSKKTARLGEFRILGDSTKKQVPLPAGVWLLGSGMALLAALRRSASPLNLA